MEQAINFWEPCWACRLVAGESVGSLVTATTEVIVAINPFPVAAGHALVMPRAHVPNVYELPDELAGPILATAARVARAIKQAYDAEGVTLRQNNDAAGDQHLFHFHLHVIPRYRGDADRWISTPEQVSAAEQNEMAERLRLALGAQPVRPRLR